MSAASITTRIYPAGMLNTLSRDEVERLHDASRGDLSGLLRCCALAVLNSGEISDDVEALFKRHRNFEIGVEQVNRGLRLQLNNAPGTAFVDGKIIEGIREMLSAVVRDLVYFDTEIQGQPQHDLHTSAGITNMVFELLRNAKALIPQVEPDLVVCWGGHSISEAEYQYTKDCGYQLGLRRLNIVTGCGPGAMKGPMKGATIAHSKQRFKSCRYIGISEPGIIAAESPNPIVSELVVMPDIEKRLEAFVRLGHGIVIFPGGVGTTEEILYLLGILLNPENDGIFFPMIMTGPKSSESYFKLIDRFVRLTLGEKASSLYKIIIDDPEALAKTMKLGLNKVRKYRVKHNDAFYFNWLLNIDLGLQMPFKPSHENMRSLEISHTLPAHQLAANLRRIFSGIVAGNVKPEGRKSIREHGPFEVCGDREIMAELDSLLSNFALDNRMKLPGGESYHPCYNVVC